MTMAETYTARDITVLDGLEPVRKRPGMYIGGVGSAGLHHLVWEILDNAVDEAMNGHAQNVQVTLHADRSSITVTDDGRGIPVDKHPKSGASALQVIFTTLHAGGKFEHRTYRTAGGLHGVGASVVNALSKELVATSKRSGYQWQQRFERGKPDIRAAARRGARGTGTTVFFRPDPKIFPRTTLDPELILHRLKVVSYLHAGIRVVFDDEAGKERSTFRHGNGLGDYLAHIVEERGKAPVHDAVFALAKDHEESGGRVNVVLQWTESTDEHLRSYVNGVPTGSGGTHESGLRAGIGKAIRNFIETHGLSPKGVTIAAEDIREGLTGVLSIFVRDPQFQGQTKDRLNNPEMVQALDSAVRPALEQWLNHNISAANAIVARIILAARARAASRAAQQEVTRKGAAASRLNLPGKLSDCSARSPADRELFIVEGDSAGGSAKQARDRQRQAILPLRGKVMNTESCIGVEGAREQGAVRRGDGARVRLREEPRPGEAALRQGHHPRGRRLGRQPHRHAAADLHLPAPAATDQPRARLPRPAAALPHRHRQGDVLGARRAAARAHPGPVGRQRQPRQGGDHALQGAGRDDAEGAVGHHAEPRDPPAAARRRQRPARDRPRDERADGGATRPPGSGSSSSAPTRSRNSTCSTGRASLAS